MLMRLRLPGLQSSRRVSCYVSAAHQLLHWARCLGGECCRVTAAVGSARPSAGGSRPFFLGGRQLEPPKWSPTPKFELLLGFRPLYFAIVEEKWDFLKILRFFIGSCGFGREGSGRSPAGLWLRHDRTEHCLRRRQEKEAGGAFQDKSTNAWHPHIFKNSETWSTG